ncbi:hypothetical protein CALVIDRAFT_427107 [Calocera viscosa TUFC12733]|uniref:Uncharacterized protein n=1 Tax=Calocera viscosa (strain TUFC12733) TaxID=1330018 RepID=A0A167PKV0_CALVF|nr:hypothetical protein CALVIDRAFT_427107 [Calocera viscosa TUFC12733]
MKGLPPPVPAVQEKEKQAITVTPTPASKVKPAPAAADQPQLQPKPASAPPSQAGPMLTSAGLQIGATLSSSFRGGLSKKEGKSRPGKVEPAAKAAKGEKAQRESEKERKAREDMEEGELEDELAPPPLPAPVPAPSAARPLAPPAATRSKLPPFSKVTPAKVDPPAYDKPTVSSASKQKPAKAALPARVDTPDRDRAGPSTSGSVSRHAARPSLDARVAGEAPSRPTSAMGSKPRTLEVLKGKEPELRKRPAAKDAEEDHDVEEGRVGKKRKTEDKLPLKRGEKVRIAAKDERAAVVRVTTTAPARKEREELKGKAVARKDDEPKSLARKDDSSLERRLARKDDSSLERKPLPKEKKDVLPERRAEIKSKKADLPERKSAAKRKMVDYSDDESDVPIAKKQKPAAVPAKEPEARARPSTVVLVKSKVVARPANAESTKREAAKLAAVDKGKRKRPDYTSSEDERDEPEERPTVRRKTASSAPLPPAASKAQPAPAPAPTPRQRAPPTQGELLIKSLRLYAEYVEIHAKIVQQKQVYEDFAAGKKNEPKMMAPEKMEKVVAEYEKIHTELIDLHTKMDEMAVAPAVSAAPAASKA